MSQIPSLNSYSANCVRLMYLDRKDAEFIKECLAKYSMPDTFCEKLNWSAFRIVNAIKGVFAESEWDKAVAIVEKRALDFVPAPLKKSFERTNISQNIANGLLDIALCANENQNIKDTKIEQKDLKKFDLRQWMDSTVKKYFDRRNPLHSKTAI
ncbi:MAG: hypothetical protein ACM3JI_04475 [Anaerolineae bacterium]